MELELKKSNRRKRQQVLGLCMLAKPIAAKFDNLLQSTIFQPKELRA